MIPPPGSRAIFVLGARDTPTRCEIVSRPKQRTVAVNRCESGHREWSTVLVLPEGESVSRPVCVSRFRP